MNARNFLHRVFVGFWAASDDPIRRAHAALKTIESTQDLPGLDLIREDILELLADREKTTASIVEDGLDPKAVVYLLITNVTWDQLCSGQHHVYRGVLNFGGNQLLDAFAKASERLIAYRVHDRQRHVADVNRLRELVKQAG